MVSILKKFLQSAQRQDVQIDQEHHLRLSTAILLIEVCRVDFHEQTLEVSRMRQLLSDQFKLDASELDDLMQQAREKADDLVSLQHITRVLNQQYDQSMKVRVIEMMWQVVYADGVKDHYEEYLLRQVAELLYVPHEQFIRARHKAEDARSLSP